MPTVATIPWILITVALWRITKGDILCMALFVSIFQAASVINLGAMGIAPWLATLLIGLIIRFFRNQGSMQVLPGINGTAFKLLMIFVCYAIFSGFAYPILFKGVFVEGSHDMSGGPLEWSMANGAQICYLLAAVVLFFLAITSTRERLHAALDWYIYGCVVASFIAFYQLANSVAHVPYPSEILYSNKRYVIFTAYMINGLWRLNGPFTEASAMAGHLGTGVAILGWNVMTRPLKWSTSLALVLMLAALLMTQSTTGYLTLIITAVVAVPLYLRLLFKQRSLSRAKAIVFLLAFLVGSSALIGTNVSKIINTAVHTVLLDKENTSSYRERTASNVAAAGSARDSYYIGTGWGSVRCSSLGYGMLATVGVIGVGLFTAFLISLLKPLLKKAQRIRPDDMYGSSLFAILILLAGMMVSSNEPDQPILWVLFAAAVAGPETVQAIPRHLERARIWLAVSAMRRSALHS